MYCIVLSIMMLFSKENVNDDMLSKNDEPAVDIKFHHVC